MNQDWIELEKEIWIKLLNGSVQPKHEFQHPALTSLSETGVHIRTLVLRKVLAKDKILLFYTDIRSKKWKDWSVNPKASALFYDRHSKTQLIIEGFITLIHNGNLCNEAWSRLSPNSRKSYMTERDPGQKTPEKTSGLLKSFDGKDLEKTETEDYRKNFGVLELKINSIEYLVLNKNGNIRSLFEYQPDNSFIASWLIP